MLSVRGYHCVYMDYWGVEFEVEIEELNSHDKYTKAIYSLWWCSQLYMCALQILEDCILDRQVGILDRILGCWEKNIFKLLSGSPTGPFLCNGLNFGKTLL